MLFGGTRPTPENPAGRPGMTDSRITHCTLEEIGTLAVERLGKSLGRVAPGHAAAGRRLPKLH